MSSPEDIVCSLELTTSGGDGSGLLRFFVMLEISMRSVCRFRCAVNVDEDSEDEKKAPERISRTEGAKQA